MRKLACPLRGGGGGLGFGGWLGRVPRDGARVASLPRERRTSTWTRWAVVRGGVGWGVQKAARNTEEIRNAAPRLAAGTSRACSHARALAPSTAPARTALHVGRPRRASVRPRRAPCARRCVTPRAVTPPRRSPRYAHTWPAAWHNPPPHPPPAPPRLAHKAAHLLPLPPRTPRFLLPHRSSPFLAVPHRSPPRSARPARPSPLPSLPRFPPSPHRPRQPWPTSRSA